MVTAQIREVFAQFSVAHHLHQNNVLIGDFNFVHSDLDKAKGMDGRDKIATKCWDPFYTALNLRDPFRTQFPTKRLYSFVSTKGCSRGDRTYVNEENVHHVVNYQYFPVPFNLAHKVVSFTIRDQQPRGPSYWKLNSSILDDHAYVRLIEGTIANVDSLRLADKQRWWDVFLTSVRSKTIEYTKRKHFIENNTRRLLRRDLERLELIPPDQLTPAQSEELYFLQEKLRLFDEKEVEGFRRRTRGLPKYDISEPTIAFYAKLEKRSAQKGIIGELKDHHGQVFSDPAHLLPITARYYRHLYTPVVIHGPTQDRLLANIDKKLSLAHRQMLDADFTDQELLQAVMDLHDDKSPGLDGITAEFYKKFWHLLRGRYVDFLNSAKLSTFRSTKNTSVTALLYKEKGEVDDLKNYRPISLINVDMKILSKALTNRLKTVLPTIIHPTQTAVAGRRIDHTVHMLRDLIQVANNENLDAAFIFLDQENAFDRVDHQFLFRTMKAFGVGDSFLDWVKRMYANATTRVKVNGYLTDRVPLLRGVRQGCPLSPLLYVFIIELLALQLRRNPDIVGFTVGGEKIVSLHYADDAIISITQNCCFKEVYKDLADYERATGARVNYGKTKGLWVGAWRGRADSPLSLKWTSTNVETLGLYFGNDHPALATFAGILPNIKRSMDYWKQFRLSKLAKARVIEIFHASRLWYAARFYPVPPPLTRQLHKAFLDYINYPLKSNTVGQDELRKLRAHGGAKLVDISCKSSASKIQWLVDLCINPNVSLHLALVTRLLGVQPGHLEGVELFFTTQHFTNKLLRIRTPFYTEAIKAMTSLTVRKQVLDPRLEKIFHNPVFTNVSGYTMSVNKPCMTAKLYTYGQLLDAQLGRYRRGITTLYRRMVNKDLDGRQDYILGTFAGDVKFSLVTQRLLYEQLLKRQYRDHHSTAKWVLKLGPLDWDKIWRGIHTPLAMEDTKSIVWELVHLNAYTTYNYNKWHNNTLCCPLCLQIPTDGFHLILTCPTTVSLWATLQPFLLRLHSSPVTPVEMAFGLIGTSPAIVLRNWFTYLLRDCIYRQETLAYYNHKGLFNELDIKRKFNVRVVRETMQRFLHYSHINRVDLFRRIYGVKDVFVKWEGEVCHLAKNFAV